MLDSTLAVTGPESSRDHRKPVKSERPFRRHLAQMKAMLERQGVTLASAKLQALCAAFYGYGSINALAAALKAGSLVIPEASPATGQESLVLLRDPETGGVFGVAPDAPALARGLVVTPYGTLVSPPAKIRGAWSGETMAMARLRTARAAFKAYTGRPFAAYDDQGAVSDLMGDILRFTHDLPEDVRSNERRTPEAIAASALRTYQRECLGEAAHEEYPDVMVSVDALDWNLAWTRDRAPCLAAAQAYAPGMIEGEPDYIAGDLIGDLLHMVASLDHGSPIETLRQALQALDRDHSLPQVTIYMSVGR